MYMKYIELGSSPVCETCVQVSKDDYIQDMKKECFRYKDYLEELFPIPDGVYAWFSVKSFNHDFGTYYEVIINYDEDEESSDFAYHVEDNLPEYWEKVWTSK